MNAIFDIFKKSPSPQETADAVLAERIRNRATAKAVAKKAEISEAKRVATQLNSCLDSLLDKVSEVENDKVDALRQLFFVVNSAVESGKDIESVVAYLKEGDKAAANQKAAERVAAKAKRKRTAK